MQPGLRPSAGPPVPPRALWARVLFDSAAELRAALEHLDTVVSGYSVEKVLLQLRYQAHTLTAECGALHRAFICRHAHKVASFEPFCVPGSPNFGLAPMATAPHCERCIFYEAKACQGMGHEAVPFGGLGGAVALQQLNRPLSSLRAEDFSEQVPAAYWLPERAHIAGIAAVARANTKKLSPTVWDIGAGNGLFGALLARDEGLRVTLIDQAPDYHTPNGVERRIEDARAERSGRPDVLFISWPPTGDGFRDLVERLDPPVVVYARDAEGFCGRHRDHCGLIARPDGLQWHSFEVDDFAPLPGKSVQMMWRSRCHHDLLKGRDTRSGLLEIRAAQPAEKLPELTPYPWE